MSNKNKNKMVPDTSMIPVSNDKLEGQLIRHPNTTCCEQNKLEINIQLFENIQLKHLIKQFEDILNRVKQLDLKYLLQPVQIATFKLKELQKVTEVSACDYYEDNPCCNKNCCNELDFPKIVNDSGKKPNLSDAVEESCECLNTRCEKSCNCSSNEGELDQNKKMLVENDCEKKTSSNTKCNPCLCSYDASGKKVKTLECKLASRAKKIKRNEAEMFELSNAIKLKKEEAKLPFSSRRSATNILAERMISNSKLEIQTNLTNLKLNLKKENTAIQDITYQNVHERNQAISCNLSSDSSSEEYYSDSSSSDQISLSKHFASRGCPRGPTETSTNKKIHSQVDCCGCGERVETIKVAENESCPCGCGDAQTLPEGKYVDRCDKCGVALAECLPTENTNVVSPKTCCAAQNGTAMKTSSKRLLGCINQFEKDVKAFQDRHYKNDNCRIEKATKNGRRL